MANTDKPANKHIQDLIRKLEQTEKRQVESLDDTRKQLKALRDIPQY